MKIRLLFMIFVLLSLAIACAPEQTQEPIKIGVITALSGDYAHIGEDIARGVKDAFNDIDSKKEFGREVEIILEDSQASPKKAVDSYNNLKVRDVKIVLSSFSGATAALNPLAKEDKTILMYNAITSTYAEENEYCFKVYSDANKEAEAIINKVKSLSGDIAIVSVINPTTQIMNAEFSKELEYVKYSFETSETDFRTIISKLKDKKAEIVIFQGYPNQIINFVKQSKELRFSPKYIIVGSDGGTKETINGVADVLAESPITYLTVGYGEVSEDIYYNFAYDLSLILIKGMQECKDPDNPECLKESLTKVKTKGKTGNLVMDNSKIVKVSPGIYTLKDKKLVEIE